MNISELKDSLSKKGKKYDIVGLVVDKLLLIVTSILFILAIQDAGFTTNNIENTPLGGVFFRPLILIAAILYLIRSIFYTEHKLTSKVFLTNFILGIFLLIIFFITIVSHSVLLSNTISFDYSLTHFFALLLFIFEVSRLKIDLITKHANPAQLFIISFGFIILSGSLLLMMPQSTTSPISFVNALFTSTSAVCVTGLTVVDTATQFTFLGKLIIIVLIQIGGIGVMTITSFFGLFFKETSSFREQIILRDFLSEDSFNGILKALMKVVFFTLIIEGIGAIFIYFTIHTDSIGTFADKLFFSIFHSISAFCNAGFSTMTDNLYDIRVRYNWNLQYSVANLVVLGGLGFPVLLNIYSYLKSQAIWLYEFIKYKKPYIHRVGMISFHSKIVIISTLILIIFGTISFILLEANATQKGMDLEGKIATSYFQSVVPRTAGFSSFDMTALAKPSVLIMIFLMWVGASPVSTGGGVKTTTFSVAILNIFRIIRSKNHIELHKHEIHEYSVNKAFAIIILSIFIICLGTFGIFLVDGDKGLLRIVFECFSAFGTVGLTLNLTPYLSISSKYILILLMFMGRMGGMTMLLSLSQKSKGNMLYRYPKENVIIT